jgi:hypothetical protein
MTFPVSLRGSLTLSLSGDRVVIELRADEARAFDHYGRRLPVAEVGPPLEPSRKSMNRREFPQRTRGIRGALKWLPSKERCHE